MRSVLLNVVLFSLTIISTFFVGGYRTDASGEPTYSIIKGVSYSLPILFILMAHEMGHYYASRKYEVPTSLPYFIPFPLSPFGTFGAIIKTKGPIPNRRALFDIGAAGPLCGLVLAIPAVIVGFRLSDVIDVSQRTTTLFSLGDSPLFLLLQRITIGKTPTGTDVVLHPIAYAGWVGLFFTSLNLLPTGQLDGGHIIYALFGRHSKIIFRLALLGISFICLIYNLPWIVLVLILWKIGYRHPPPLDDRIPLDWPRKVIGAFTFLIFFTAFTPIPFPGMAFGIGDVLHQWLHV